MERALLIVATGMALAIAGCGDSTSSTTTTSATQQPIVTTTTAAPPPATTEATTTTTTTTEPAPTTEAPPPESAVAAFAITQVQFGEPAFVQITNTGNGTGDPAGHWICQRPVYFELPSIELGPGESVWVAADGGDLQFVGAVVGVVDAQGRIGSLVPSSGEIALYRSNDFGNADAIVDYVEWGSAGHGRSSVATDAGIWPAGGFVEIPDNTIAISAVVGGADAPEGWSPDIGV